MNILSRINRNTSVEEALAILATIESAEQEKEGEKGIEDQDDNLPALRRKLREIQKEHALLNSLIDKVYDANAAAHMDELKAVATESCRDYRTAYDLTTFYSKEWFSRLFFNLDAKSEFADHLITLVKPYNPGNIETWEMIRDSNPEMLEYISVPHLDLS